MSITKQDIIAVQEQWGNGIVKIGAAFMEKQDYTAAAQEHIDTLYAYGLSTVLFKPTKAAEDQLPCFVRSCGTTARCNGVGHMGRHRLEALAPANRQSHEQYLGGARPGGHAARMGRISFPRCVAIGFLARTPDIIIFILAPI